MKVVKRHLPTNRWSGEWQVINHILVMEVRKETKEMKGKRKGNKVSKKERKMGNERERERWKVLKTEQQRNRLQNKWGGGIAKKKK